MEEVVVAHMELGLDRRMVEEKEVVDLGRNMEEMVVAHMELDPDRSMVEKVVVVCIEVDQDRRMEAAVDQDHKTEEILLELVLEPE
jgi:hypothetical protein